MSEEGRSDEKPEEKPRKKPRRGRGEGEIEELPSGRFRAVVSLGRDPKTRKRVRLKKTFPTKREALDWRAEKVRELKSGSLTATSTTLGEWLTTWLEIRKPNVAANTYRTESHTAEKRLRVDLGEVRLRDLNALALERWLARIATAGVSQNERRKAAKLLKLVLNDAVRRKVVGLNPMCGVPIPRRPDTEARAMDAAQLTTFLATAEAAGQGTLFRTWADAGLRPGELYGLFKSDFDPVAGKLAIRRAVCATTGHLKQLKTKRSKRTLLLAPSTIRGLGCTAHQMSDNVPLFPTPRGLHWNNANFAWQLLRPIKTAAGLPWVTPYTMRHTMATLLLQAGVSLKVVSERLGHEDVTTTLKSYAHVLPGMQERAAEVMEGLLNPKSTVPGGTVGTTQQEAA